MGRKNGVMIMMIVIALFFILMSIKEGLPVMPPVFLGITLIGITYIMRDGKNIFEVFKPLIIWIIGCLGLFIAILFIASYFGF